VYRCAPVDDEAVVADTCTGVLL